MCLVKAFPNKVLCYYKRGKKTFRSTGTEGGRRARADTHTHTQRHTLQQGKGRTPQFDELKLLPSFPGGGFLPSLFLVLFFTEGLGRPMTRAYPGSASCTGNSGDYRRRCRIWAALKMSYSPSNRERWKRRNRRSLPWPERRPSAGSTVSSSRRCRTSKPLSGTCEQDGASRSTAEYSNSPCPWWRCPSLRHNNRRCRGVERTSGGNPLRRNTVPSGTCSNTSCSNRKARNERRYQYLDVNILSLQ